MDHRIIWFVVLAHCCGIVQFPDLFRCSIIRFTVDVREIRRGYRSYRKFGAAFYEKALRNNNSSNILCHVFSMNGCSMFCGLWDKLGTVEDGESIKKKFKGVIFDRFGTFRFF